MEAPPAAVLQLPTELQLHFLSFLPAKSLAAAMRTCRFWCELARDEKLWRALVERHWAYRNPRILASASSMRTYYGERAAFEQNRCNKIIFCSDVFLGIANPDGSDMRPLRRTNSLLIQPTWDPFSRSIIWTERAATEFVIRGCKADGSEMWTHPSGNYMPFYYYWLPDGATCAYLGTAPGPGRFMELRMLHIRPSIAQAPPVTRGRPCFWSFNPAQAGAIVGRVSGNIVIRRDEQTPMQIVPQWPATGMSPQWSASGRYILVSTGVEDFRNTVALLNASDLTLARQIASLTGRTRCIMSRNEQLVYYTNSSELNLIQRARGIFQGSLHAYNMSTGETTQLTEGPVIAFFPSPDSAKVIWIEETKYGSHVLSCWEATTGRTFSAPPVQLRDQFLEQYLPFFDQYHQSMTVFSPDSAAITFAASLGAGPSAQGGVFTLQLQPGAAPHLIYQDPADEEPIVMAAWSPT